VPDEGDTEDGEELGENGETLTGDDVEEGDESDVTGE
jgi:hypothetical protein